MTASAYLVLLFRQHRALEAELAESLRYPSVGNFTLTEIKRRKLRLKDEMTRLARLEGR
jgi:hypothetical protein